MYMMNYESSHEPFLVAASLNLLLCCIVEVMQEYISELLHFN